MPGGCTNVCVVFLSLCRKHKKRLSQKMKKNCESVKPMKIVLSERPVLMCFYACIVCGLGKENSHVCVNCGLSDNALDY